MITPIEEIRKRLQTKEDNYNRQVGKRPFGVMPPITKFTLSDPDRLVPSDVSILQENYYVILGEDIYPTYVSDPDWDTYKVSFDGPQTLRDNRVVSYQGYLFGAASIVFLDGAGRVLGSFKAPDGEIIKDIQSITPEGTSWIEVSRYRNAPADAWINFNLALQTFNEMNVTNNVASWTDLEVILQRDLTSGSFSSVSFPVFLTELAKDFMVEVFDMYAMHSRIAFNVYLRDDVKLNVYRLIKSSPMDFQTYKQTDTQVEITLIDAELDEQLNTGGKTKYDIPVSEVAATKKWNYDRMTMLNRGNYELTDQDGPMGNAKYLQLYLYLASSEMTPGSAENIFQTQSSENFQDITTSNNYFFKAVEGWTFQLNMNFHFEFRWQPFQPFDERPDTYLVVYKNNDPTLPIFSQLLDQTTDGDYYIDEIVLSKVVGDIFLEKDDTLSFYLQRDNAVGVSPFSKITLPSFTEFSLSYTTIGKPINDLNVIKPETLCQNLLDRISGVKNLFTCQFNWGDIDYIPMLCAAETIRNIPNANIHAALNDILDWMKVLGYEYSADNRVLVFKQRDEFFKPDVTALTLKGKENADLRIEGSDKFAYTSVMIGYEAQDYESVNGRFEVNGMFEYSTGYTNITRNDLKLISPYRADPIGIELLCWERKNSTKDTKSDNDIFVIAMNENEDHYSVYDSIVATLDEALNLEMFNAVFNPYFLVKQNESLIGINSRYLKFTSTDSNRNSHVTGVADIYADQPIEKQLFKPFTYNFVTGNVIPLPGPDVRDGLIKFWYNNVLKSGYIFRILKNYSKELESTWILYAK